MEIDDFRECVKRERARQIEQGRSRTNYDEVWHLILSEEVGEVAEAILEAHQDGYPFSLIEELAQCAAVIETWVEDIGNWE